MEVPILFSSTKNPEENKEAEKLLLQSGIPCKFTGLTDNPKPVLVFGPHRFEGIKEIIEFIEQWKNYRKLR